MKRLPFLSAVLFLLAFQGYGQEKKVPSFEEVLSLPGVGSPIISPDGRHVMYSHSTYDWKKNRRDAEIWLSKDGEPPFQLTNTADGSSTGGTWSPNSQWIVFRAKRGDKTRLFAIRAAGGEAHCITPHIDGNIGSFEFSPEGNHLIFTLTDDEDAEAKEREERFGAYEVDDQEYKLSSLHRMPFEPEFRDPNEFPCYEKSDSLKKLHCLSLPEPEVLLESEDYTVSGFTISPDGKHVAFAKQPDPLRNSWFNADMALLNLETKEVRELVANSSYDGPVDWSPDSKSILFSSGLENRESIYYKNNRFFIIPIAGGTPREVAADFDEDKSVIEWNTGGIYFAAWQKTNRHLYRLNPEDGSVEQLAGMPEMFYWASFSEDGTQMAYHGRTGSSLTEIYTKDLDAQNRQQLTFTNKLIEDWKVSQSEVIQWESKDGALIEGVLHKPMDFDPNKKYPLFVVIHGGPTGISTPSPVPGGVYPILQWLDKGALVLQPNYRGSAGYGEAFRELNVRNLGVGDAWDVLSGVDYLAEQGMIDTSRMGCMGWSQGGYISAFLTTTSNRFKAISVGAGISNWMTYYVNTDIHPFTRQYLKATPWEDEEIYKKTSPMTYINQATTPTLIQHGENDQRVPIPNAYELLQGLRDVGVPSKLIVYKGFGHGINKPKERLAATWHNWQWFNQYIWGEEVKLPYEEEPEANKAEGED